MTPERLSHLASRAAVGELTASEQRECMLLVHQLYSLLGDTKLTVNIRGAAEMAAAAKLPPQRKRCEACGGSGGHWNGVGMPRRDWDCEDCGGSGYISEDQK